MKPSPHSLCAGFSILETLLTLGIMTLISTTIYVSFVSLNKKEALEKESVSLVALLAEARSLTLGSKDASEYGVHFESGAVALFKGLTYSSSDPTTITVKLNPLVRIKNIQLSGGVVNVIFDRLSGDTSQNGSVTLSLVSDPSIIKTINIDKTGLSEIN